MSHCGLYRSTVFIRAVFSRYCAVVQVFACSRIHKGNQMLRSIRMNQILLFVCVLFAGQNLFADGGAASRDQADAFFAAHAGRWSGKVQSTIGEAEISKVDEESLNYLDFDYIKSNGLLTMRNYGPRSGGRGFSHYDAVKKVIRSINHGVGGVVTHHEIYPKNGHWNRTSKQINPDGSMREFTSTIKFLDNNRTIQIDIHLMKNGEKVSSQTNVWRRIE